MVNVCATDVAGFQSELPSCDALIVHEPPPVMCASVRVKVQLPLAENATASWDEAVAVKLKSASRNLLSGRASNAIC